MFKAVNKTNDNKKFVILTVLNCLTLVSHLFLLTVCPPSKPIVYCKVNPCQVNKCAKYPDAICKPNYCGGCNADFYLNGEKVDCKNPSSYDAMPRRECPPGKPLVYCWRNPCQGQTCESHPNARCVPNFCGGCFFSFYVGWRRVNC